METGETMKKLGNQRNLENWETMKKLEKLGNWRIREVVDNALKIKDGILMRENNRQLWKLSYLIKVQNLSNSEHMCMTTRILMFTVRKYT